MRKDMSDKIPLVDLKAQFAAIKPEIDSAIARVIANTSFIGGREVSQFEEAFAAFQRTRYCVGVASGTAAIYLVLKALGIGAGDEVITTPHTFIASAEPIEALGARTVLVDIDPLTFNLDPALVEAAITERTKAILPVHLYGQITGMDRLAEIARRRGVHLIEDAAQAHGAEFQGERAGHWGIASCFSFYPGKNLGAYGDGGAVCTNDESLAKILAKLRDHGRMSKYEHDIIGYGERLDSLQAAILGAKLPYLDGWNTARRNHAAYYDQAFTGVNGLQTPREADGARHIYHIYSARVRGDRDAALAALKERGIEVGVHYPVPLHMQPALTHLGYPKGAFPHTEQAAKSIISLPMYPGLTLEQISRVVEEVADVVG